MLRAECPDDIPFTLTAFIPVQGSYGASSVVICGSQLPEYTGGARVRLKKSADFLSHRSGEVDEDPKHTRSSRNYTSNDTVQHGPDGDICFGP